MRYYFLIQSFLFTLLLLTVVAICIGKFNCISAVGTCYGMAM